MEQLRLFRKGVPDIAVDDSHRKCVRDLTSPSHVNGVAESPLEQITSLEGGYLTVLLSKYGIKVKSVTEPTDDTPAGKLHEQMMAVFAEFDINLRADRTVTGMKAAVEKGRFPHRAPLGYRNIPGSETRIPLACLKQHSYWKRSELSLGDAVSTLVLVLSLGFQDLP